MTNFEKYKDDVLFIVKQGHSIAFDVDKNIVIPCPHHNCQCCLFSNSKTRCRCTAIEWLYEEYVEHKAPEINWYTMPVDTKLYVRDEDDQAWEPRYFSHYGYKTHIVYTFASGATSWSTAGSIAHTTPWKQAKLAEECDNK